MWFWRWFGLPLQTRFLWVMVPWWIKRKIQSVRLLGARHNIRERSLGISTWISKGSDFRSPRLDYDIELVNIDTIDEINTKVALTPLMPDFVSSWLQMDCNATNGIAQQSHNKVQIFTIRHAFDVRTAWDCDCWSAYWLEEHEKPLDFNQHRRTSRLSRNR